VYTIGLGDPDNAPRAPDPDFLGQVANQDGVSSPSEPKGEMYFAPTAEELDDTFRSVAESILVRLSE
jgi:hypothetical protein